MRNPTELHESSEIFRPYIAERGILVDVGFSMQGHSKLTCGFCFRAEGVKLQDLQSMKP